jgi:hypothetical protein
MQQRKSSWAIIGGCCIVLFVLAGISTIVLPSTGFAISHQQMKAIVFAVVSVTLLALAASTLHSSKWPRSRSFSMTAGCFSGPGMLIFLTFILCAAVALTCMVIAYRSQHDDQLAPQRHERLESVGSDSSKLDTPKYGGTGIGGIQYVPPIESSHKHRI